MGVFDKQDYSSLIATQDVIEAMYNSPVEPYKAPVAVDDTPLLYDMATSFKRGLTVGVPQMAGGVIKALSPVDSDIYARAQDLQDNAKQRAARPDMQNNNTKRGILGETLVAGAEGVGQMVPVIAGSILNPLAGAGVAGVMFGGSTYQDTKERLLKQEGLDDVYASANPSDERVKKAKTTGLVTGVVQGAGEAGMSYLGGRFLKGAFPKFGKQTAEGVVKGFATPGISTIKNFGKAWGAEVVGEGVTEAIQDEAQAAVERAAGLKDAPKFMAQAADSAKGGVGAALLLGPLAGTGHYKAFRNASQVEKALSDPSTDAGLRLHAAAVMAKEIAKSDESAAENFLDHALDAIGDEEHTGTEPYALDLNNPALLQPFSVEPSPGPPSGETVQAPADQAHAMPVQQGTPSGTSMLNDSNQQPPSPAPAGPMSKALTAGGINVNRNTLGIADLVSQARQQRGGIATIPADTGALNPQPVASELEQAFEWANNQISSGNGFGLMQNRGVSDVQHATNILNRYRAQQQTNIQGANNGDGNILSAVQGEGPSEVERLRLAVPDLQGQVAGIGSNHRQTGGVSDGNLSAVPQKVNGETPQVSTVRGEDVNRIAALQQEKQTLLTNGSRGIAGNVFTPETLQRVKEINKEIQHLQSTPGNINTTSKSAPASSVNTVKPAKGPNPRRQLDASKDSLIVAVAKMGGISRSDVERQAGNAKDLTHSLNKIASKEAKAGRMHVISPKGQSLDYMREALVEQGYLPEGSSINDLLDRLDSSSRGTVHRSNQVGGEVAENLYDQQAARFQAMLNDMTDEEYEEFTRNQWLDEQTELLAGDESLIEEYLSDFDTETMTAEDWIAVENEFKEALDGEFRSDSSGKEDQGQVQEDAARPAESISSISESDTEGEGENVTKAESSNNDTVNHVKKAQFKGAKEFNGSPSELAVGDEVRLSAEQAQVVADHYDTGKIRRVTNRHFFEAGTDSGNAEYGHKFSYQNTPVKGITSFAINSDEDIIDVKLNGQPDSDSMVLYAVKPEDVGGDFVAVRKNNDTVFLYSNNPVDTNKATVISHGLKLQAQAKEIAKQKEGHIHEIETYSSTTDVFTALGVEVESRFREEGYTERLEQPEEPGSLGKADTGETGGDKRTGEIVSSFADVHDKNKNVEHYQEQSTTSAYGSSNKLVTADRAAELRKKLKAKFDNQINSGIDPEMLSLGTELAIFHIEAGVRKFSAFATAIAKDLDVPVHRLREYLRGWYNGARDIIEDKGLSIDGMDDSAQVREAHKALFEEKPAGLPRTERTKSKHRQNLEKMLANAKTEQGKTNWRKRLDALKQKEEQAAANKVAEKEKPHDVSLSTATTPSATKPATTKNKSAKQESTTSDVGEELWYNRRNHTGRGIVWNDIKDLNDTLKTKEVTKSKVWPRPDYEQLVSDGLHPLFARVLKNIYDGIGNNPQSKSDEALQEYINIVNRVRNAVIGWMKDTSAQSAFMDSVVDGAKRDVNISKGGPVAMSELMKSSDFTKTFMDMLWPAEMTKPSYGRFSRGSEANKEAHAIGGNRALKAMQISKQDLVKFMKEIEVGWPGKREAWQTRGYSVQPSATIPIERGYRYDSSATGNNEKQVVWYTRIAGSFPTEVEARKALTDKGAFLLLDKVQRIKGGYDTREQAEEAARKLTSREGVKSGRDLRGMNITEAERTGPDRRSVDEDISSKRFMDTFGFKGVNFGRQGYINDVERQEYLNHAYDALLDLSDMLGIPVKALSLNGELGIAFGAQGRGGHAAAHFVPGHNEINMTKTMGAGTLAHEWGHALDHYFGVMAGLGKTTEPYLSEHATYPGSNSGINTDSIRPEVVQAFKTIVETMTRRPMTENEWMLRQNSSISKSTKNVKSWLDHARKQFEQQTKQNKTERLKDFDVLAERIVAGDLGDGYINDPRSRHTAWKPAVNELRLLFKDATGRILDKDTSTSIQSWAWSETTASEAKQAVPEHLPQTATDYERESRRMDADKKGKPYWATKVEMFARAFELFVNDKLAEQNFRNTFLSNAGIHADINNTDDIGNAYPYPRNTERAKINEAFQSLIGTLETRETEKGTAMFALAPGDSKQSSVVAEFNDSLELLMNNQLPAHYVFNLGKPSKILTDTGVPSLPIKMKQSTVQKIIGKLDDGTGKHGIPLDLLYNLPRHINNPVAVFSSDTQAEAKTLILQFAHNNKQLMVALHLEKKMGNIEVNEVASVYGKPSDVYVNWVLKGRLESLDKIKGQWLLERLRRSIRPETSGSLTPNKILYHVAEPVKSGVREDVEGNNVSFKLASSKSNGIGAEKAQAWVSTLPIAKHVNVVQSVEQLPAAARAEIEKAGVDPSWVQAMELHGTIHVITDNVPDLRRVKALVIGHELAHAGQTKKIVDFAVDWFKRTKNGKTEQAIAAQRLLQRVADIYGYDLDNEKHFRLAVQEATAAYAEQAADGKLPQAGLMQRLFMYIKHWLRQNGLISHVSDSELSLAVAEMLRIGEKRLSVGKGGSEGMLAKVNYREMRVPVQDEVFERVGVPKGNVFADYLKLQEKHPEYFGTPEQVKQHVEFVLDNPSDIMTASKDEYTLLVRNDGEDRAAVVEFALRGGKYRVRSAYIMKSGQLETKKEKALRAVSKPNPDENLQENIDQGGGVPSHTLRAEPSSDIIVSLADENVNAKFALADSTLDNLHDFWEQHGSDNIASSIGRLINPFDWSRSRQWFERVAPDSVKNAAGWLFGTPVNQADLDPNKRPFVDAGIQREEDNIGFQLRFMGWDGQTNPSTFIGRFKDTFGRWNNADKSTAWGRVQSANAELSAAQQDAVNVLLVEGDRRSKVYTSLEKAMANPTIAAAKPTAEAFAVYKSVRHHIDTVVAREKEKIIEELLHSTTMKKSEIEGHISDYRKTMAERPGWLPRDHGEGKHQVNVYHLVESLKFDVKSVTTEAHGNNSSQAYLPYYVGPVATDMLEDIVKNINKKYNEASSDKRLKFGAFINGKVLTANGQMIVTGSKADVAEFLQAAQDVLPQVVEKNKQHLADLQAKRDQQVEKGVSAAILRALDAQIKTASDTRVRVKVFMQLHESQSRAEKSLNKVRKDMKAAMPVNFRQGEKYESDYRVADSMTESTYGDLAGDMAMERAQLEAIKRATQSGEISKDEADKLRDEIIRSSAEVLLGRAAGRSQIQRAPYLIEGYTTDGAVQQYHDYMTATSGQLSKVLYAREQFDNFRAAPPEVKVWAEKYIKDSLRNMDEADRISGNARMLASFWYLGFKMSSVLVDGTQVWTWGVAELGRRTKQNSVKAIGKAQLDIIRGNLSKDEQDLFNSQIWKQQEMRTTINDVTGAGEGATGKASEFMHTLTGKAMFFFQEMELMNRRIMILAAYRSGLADGMSKQEAIDFALDVNRMANIETSRANLPGWARKPLGRTAYALQMFVWNNWNWIYGRATSGKKADMLALLKYGALIGLIGGASAMAGGDEADKIYRRMFGRSIKLDLQKWTRQHLKEYGSPGELLNDFIWHGGAGALGVNISNSMRLNVPMSGLLTGDSNASEAAMGVFAGLAQKAKQAGGYAVRGQIGRAIESAAPEAIAAPMKAYRMATEGATTSHGKPVLDERGRPIKFSTAEAVARGFGLQPLEQSDRAATAQSLNKINAHWDERRKDVLDGLRTGNANSMDVMKFNTELRKSQAWPKVSIIKAATVREIGRVKPDKKKMQQQAAWL